jgi:type VI secretion system protein ImpC
MQRKTMANIPMQFSFTAGRPQNARRVDDDDPFCMLVVADLGVSAKARAMRPPAQRRPLKLDLDNFDTVFKAMGVELELDFANAPVTLKFASLDDFHPDQLFARMAGFAALRQKRADLSDPKRFREAADSLGGSPKAPDSSVSPAPDAQATGDLERLLGRKPAGAAGAVAAQVSPTDASLDAWLRTLVAPHVLPDIGNEQARLIAAVDNTLAAEMRRLLQQPAFMRLEANWRSIERLVRELDPGESLLLSVVDLSANELALDLTTHASDLSGSALHQWLNSPQTQGPDGQRWSLLVSDLEVGAQLADLQRLAAMGALAGRAGAPLLATAQPSLLGCTGAQTLASPKAWQPLQADVAAYWSALRQSPVAPWIGLALPRVLLRLPYGKNSDPISTFAFEEMPEHQHASYLWGNAAFALALLAGQAFLESAWEMELGAGVDLGDMPSHSYREGGESQQQPCAEVLMGETAADAISRQGLMPVMSYRNRNAVRLLRWQSVAEPARALQGVWS